MTDAPSHPPAPRWRVLRPLTAIVVLVLVAGTLAAAWGTRNLGDDQEKRLLNERAREVGLVLNQAVTTLQASLANVGGALQAAPGDQARFAAVARPQVQTPGGARALAVLKPVDGGFAVVMSVGTGLSAGQTLGPPTSTTAETALTHPGLYSTPVVQRGAQKVVGLAAGPPIAPPGMVLYQESPVTGAQASTLNNGPYSELYIALYDGQKAQPSQLVLANIASLPLPGRVVSVPFKIGQSPWLLQVASRTPLVGSVAANSGWIVLGIGLIGTVLVGLLSEVVLRRRDYALVMVAERTGELRRSLADLETAQEQLVRQERLAAIGQLASVVGHELRNPLGVISNTLYLLRRTSDPADERTTRHLDTAEREVSAATLIVSDLLEFAKARPPMIDAVDVDALVDEALSVAPAPGGIAVSWQPAAGLPPAAADRDQLRQVLLNLITNAYDAMGERGTLTVEAGADGPGRLRITVKDDGSGMDEDTRRQIFEPFFTTKARGVGLGLAVSARIVSSHQGALEVDSTPGGGSTFTLLLPVFDGGRSA